MRKPTDIVQDCALISEVDTLPAYTNDSKFSPVLPVIAPETPVISAGNPAVLASSDGHEDQPGIDGLKFRIVTVGTKHFFRDVRFHGRYVNTAEKKAIAHYLEGRCLEKIRREDIARSFNGSAYLGSLQTLVSELQHIICD
jgi:hypothetical protein